MCTVRRYYGIGNQAENAGRRGRPASTQPCIAPAGRRPPAARRTTGPARARRPSPTPAGRAACNRASCGGTVAQHMRGTVVAFACMLGAVAAASCCSLIRPASISSVVVLCLLRVLPCVLCGVCLYASTLTRLPPPLLHALTVAVCALQCNLHHRTGVPAGRPAAVVNLPMVCVRASSCRGTSRTRNS